METYIFGLFIWHFDPRATSTGEKIHLYAFGLISLTILSTIVTHHSILGLMEIGMRVRIASSSLMYRKVFSLVNILQKSFVYPKDLLDISLTKFSL